MIQNHDGAQQVRYIQQMINWNKHVIISEYGYYLNCPNDS